MTSEMDVGRSPARRVRVALIVVALTAVIAGCGNGWSSDDVDNVRNKLCVDQLRVGKNSAPCDCVIKVVKQYWSTSDDFYGSKSAPDGFMSDLQSCG